MRLFGGAVLLVMFLVPSVAFAGNDDGVLIGDDAAMMGGAVVAVTSNGAALWYNPSGIVSAEERTLDVSGTAYTLRLHRTPRLLVARDGTEANGNINEFAVVPAALTYVRPISDRVRVGLGVFQPFARSVALNATLRSRAPANEWTLGIKDSLTVQTAIVGLGWRAHERLSIGFSVGVLYASAQESGQFAGTAADGSERFATFAALSAITGVGATVGFGLQWKAVDGLTLGLSVRSPTVLLYAQAREEIIHSYNGTELGSDRMLVDGSGVGFEPLLPARIRVGAAYHRNAWTVSLDIDAQHRLGATRRGIVNVKLGARAQVGENVSIGFGAFTDRSADAGGIQFLSQRQDFYGGTFGVSFESVRKLDQDTESSPRMLFGTTVALRYAYGFGETVALAVDDDFDNRGIGEGLLVSTSTHELGLTLAARLRF